MAIDVIMPALGMAQTTGVIVNWLKAQGDAVAEGDPLMEVETDKAVMEVAALASGFLVEIRHPAGADVPVGEVVALIGARPADGDAPMPAAVSASGATLPATAPVNPSSADAVASVPGVPVAPFHGGVHGGRGQILASPKARRLAHARGIDLRQVLAQGGQEPLHAADIEGFRPVAAPEISSEISAEIDASPLVEFREWLAGQQIAPTAVLAALAASALRRPARIRVETRHQAEDYAVPARTGLTALMAEPPQGTPDLILRDLTGSRVTRVRLSGDAVPVLTLTDAAPGRLALTLTFPDGQLASETAFALIEGFSARAEDPLLLLL